MKKKIFYKLTIITLLISVSIILNAQQLESLNSYDSIYKIKLGYVEDLAEQQSKDIDELTEYKWFINWANRYATKLGEDGTINDFGEVIYNYYDSNTDIEGDIDFTWEYFSPDGIWTDWNDSLQGGSGQGLIISIWIDENDLDHIMAGGQYCGGLWETLNGGDSWENISENEPMIQGVSSIFVNPDTVIYVTTTYDAEDPDGYANGLYYTDNGGENWYLDSCYTYNPFEITPSYKYYYPFGNAKLSPRVFLQNPTNDSIMYLLTAYRLLFSDDKGENWTVLIDKLTNNPGIYDITLGKQYFNDMIFDPANDSIVYVTGPEAFRIDSNGTAITNITKHLLPDPTDSIALTILVDAHINYPDSIWFVLRDTSIKETHVVLYNKASENYTIKSTGEDISVNWTLCEVSPQNANYIAIGGNWAYCYDFADDSLGLFLRQPGFHNDMRSAEWPDVGDSTDFIIFGTDGGLSKVYNFKPMNNYDCDFEYLGGEDTNSIRNIDVQGFDVSRYGKDIIVSGTEHNGMIVGIDSLWIKPFSGGDYGTILIDPDNSTNFYATRYATRYLENYSNYGHERDSFYIYEEFSGHYHDYPVLFFKPGDNKTIYAGYNDTILEFDAENLSISNDPVKHNLPADSYKHKYIKEYGINDDLKNLFFVSTDRYWRTWEGEDWDCEYSAGGKPHTLALLKVEIEQDGSLTYHDLSDNLNIDQGLCGGYITGLAVEVNSSDTIAYATFGNTSSDNDPQKNKKVYYSKDLGETWYAMADSLPPRIPVNDIQYHKESGMLYLVNDIGVYYFDRSDSIWMNITSDLPPMSYSQIRFSHKRGKMLVGSHAKGVWEADTPCFSDSVDIDIRANTTWDYSVPIKGDITIESGATLTVKNEVYMPTCSRVIIERGGKLVIDGGKFTHACDEYWGGIEVQGTSTAAQNSISQGWLEIKNGGAVEYSSLGVYTAKTNSCGGSRVLGYYGGIIQCDSAYFINNKVAARFWDYTTSSLSYFNLTTFETNDDYFYGTDPNYFVEIYSMTGIDFDTCLFVNNTSEDQFQDGAYCYNSSVNFDGGCEPGDTCTFCNDGGSFRNLYFGIKSYSTAVNKYLDVRNTKFLKNYRAVYVSGSDGCRLTSNTFIIDEEFVTNGGCGMYLDASTAYWVEDNRFIHNGDTATGVGIVVHNSGGDANEIYLNYFDNLEQGISAQEQNKGSRAGLQILCNEFDECLGDIFVPESIYEGRGIAANQGVANSDDPKDMAGNEFYYEESKIDFDDINNEGIGIYYYYDINFLYNVKPEDYYGTELESTNTDPDWSPSEGCPSQTSSGGGGGTKSTILSYKEQLAYYSEQVESTHQLLEGLIDGGNTEALNTNVELSTPLETMEIYTELLNESPYLSEIVIESAIEKEAVLLNAMIRDVMVANPHTANSNQLIDKLDERINPMPNYMKAQILQGQNTVSLIQELESQMSAYKLKQTRAINGIIREYLTELNSQQAISDSIIVLLESVDNKYIKYRQAMLHLQRKEYIIGNNVLNAIPQKYNLNNEEITEHDNLTNYYALVAGIKQDGRNELQANNNEVQQLENIVETSNGLAGTYSRNVLIAMHKMDYLAPIQLPDLYKSTKEKDELMEIINTEPPSKINVFPNPSRGYVIVEYQIDIEKKGIIEVKDANGRILRQVQFNNLQDQVTIITYGWEPGLYIVTLRIDGKSIESCKFTLVN